MRSCLSGAFDQRKKHHPSLECRGKDHRIHTIENWCEGDHRWVISPRHQANILFDLNVFDIPFHNTSAAWKMSCHISAHTHLLHTRPTTNTHPVTHPLHTTSHTPDRTLSHIYPAIPSSLFNRLSHIWFWSCVPISCLDQSHQWWEWKGNPKEDIMSDLDTYLLTDPEIRMVSENHCCSCCIYTKNTLFT